MPADPSTSVTSTDGVTYKITLRYDGRAYYGWQRHPGRPTIQGEIERAVQELFGVRCAVHASGRTDRGVHADAQVAHFTVPASSEEPQLAARVGARLKSDIEVLECRRVPRDFHAREDALAKTYRYEIWNAPRCPPARQGRVWHIPGALDVAAMKHAVPVLMGTHDFASFATKANHERRSTVRTLHDIAVEPDEPQLTMRFTADGFLYKMVRNLVRALVKVGEGRYDADKLSAILSAQDRQAAPGTAPASGLYLQSVQYAASE